MNGQDALQALNVESLEEEYRRRYGLAVEMIKREVGPGDEYSNEVARVVVSSKGAWFECNDLPMEFSGATGATVVRKLLSDTETRCLLDRLHALTLIATPADTHALGLFVLYDCTGVTDPKHCFAYNLASGEPGLERPSQRIGEYREGVVPRVFRCRIHTRLPAKGVPVTRGSMFGLAGVGETNLFVSLEFTGEELRDLGRTPVGDLQQ